MKRSLVLLQPSFDVPVNGEKTTHDSAFVPLGGVVRHFPQGNGCTMPRPGFSGDKNPRTGKFSN